MPGSHGVDAVIAGSADVTLTTLAALHDLALRVPEDVALIGTGQVDWARFAAPPLSMIEIDGGEIGSLAVSLALARIRDSESASVSRPRQTIVLPARLTLRDSSASSLAARPAPAG